MNNVTESIISDSLSGKKAVELLQQQEILPEIQVTTQDMCVHLLDVYPDRIDALALVATICEFAKSDADQKFWSEIFDLLLMGPQVCWNNDMLMDDLVDKEIIEKSQEIIDNTDVDFIPINPFHRDGVYMEA